MTRMREAGSRLAATLALLLALLAGAVPVAPLGGTPTDPGAAHGAAARAEAVLPSPGRAMPALPADEIEPGLMPAPPAASAAFVLAARSQPSNPVFSGRALPRPYPRGPPLRAA